MKTCELYLASTSPRRQILLKQLNINYEVIKLSIDESPNATENPLEYVQRIAKKKALAALTKRTHSTIPVLAADTTVVINNKILGKPANLNEALQMLRELSGKEHRVLTAVFIAKDQEQHEALLSETKVNFKALSACEIEAYCNTQEPMDKAGAYAIQGLGSVFVERIEGSYSGVMGLPLFETAELLKRFNIKVLNAS